MSNVVAAINEAELGELSLDILNYIDRISVIFDKIDTCMEKLPNHYKGPSSRELLKLYQEFKIYRPIMKSNLISYSDDFIELIKKMKENDKYLVTLFQNFADETTNKAKSIKEIRR